MCTSQTTVVLSRKKKTQRHAVILQPVFGSKNCCVKPWSTRPPSCAKTEVIKTEALFLGQKGGISGSTASQLYRLPKKSYLIPGLVFGKPWMFSSTKNEKKIKMSIPTVFLKGFFCTFFNHRKTETKRKGACNIRHAKRALRLFSKEHLQNQEVLNTHKTWQFTQFLQANAFISTCFGNTPWHLKQRIQRKKTEKVHPTTSASKIKVINLSPIFPVSPTPFEEKTCSQLPWSLFSIACWPPPLNGSPRQSDHALAASAAPIDSAHASPSAPSTFHGHHARQGKKPAMFCCFHWVWKCRRTECKDNFPTPKKLSIIFDHRISSSKSGLNRICKSWQHSWPNETCRNSFRLHPAVLTSHRNNPNVQIYPKNVQ